MSQTSESIVDQSPTVVLPDTIVVAVTDEDLLLGVRRDPWQCAVVRSLRRALALSGVQADCISVGSSGFAHVHAGERCGNYSHDASEWIHDWDHGATVHPFTVTFTAENGW